MWSDTLGVGCVAKVALMSTLLDDVSCKYELFTGGVPVVEH